MTGSAVNRVLSCSSVSPRTQRVVPGTTTVRWRDKKAQRALRSGGCFCWVFRGAPHVAAILRTVRKQLISLISGRILHVVGQRHGR